LIAYGSTKVDFFSVDPSVIFKAAVDEYQRKGGQISYTAASIEAPGTSVSYTFNSNSVMDVLNKGLELAPVGWYYFIDQTTNLLHFHNKGTTPDHIFTIGKDVTVLANETSFEDVINTVYFTGAPGYYWKFQNAASANSAVGEQAYFYSDGRVSRDDTAQTIAQRIINTSPTISIDIAITDNNLNTIGYDIESIKLGQMVQIANSGVAANSQYDVATFDNSPFDYDTSNIGSIVFQITNLDYTDQKVSMSLSTAPPDISKRIADIQRNIQDTTTAANPSIPTLVSI